MGCRVNDNNLATQRPFFLRASDEQALVPFQDFISTVELCPIYHIGRKASAFLGREEIDFLPLPPLFLISVDSKEASLKD